MNDDSQFTITLAGATVTLNVGVIGQDSAPIPKLGYFMGAGLTSLVWPLQDHTPGWIIPQFSELIQNIINDTSSQIEVTDESQNPAYVTMHNAMVTALSRIIEEFGTTCVREDTVIETHKLRVEVHFLLNQDNYKSLVPTSGCVWVEATVTATKQVKPPQYTSSDKCIILTQLVDTEAEYMLLTPQKEVDVQREFDQLLKNEKRQEEPGGDNN